MNRRRSSSWLPWRGHHGFGRKREACTKRSELNRRNQLGAPLRRERYCAAHTEVRGKILFKGKMVWFKAFQRQVKKRLSNIDRSCRYPYRWMRSPLESTSPPLPNKPIGHLASARLHVSKAYLLVKVTTSVPFAAKWRTANARFFSSSSRSM